MRSAINGCRAPFHGLPQSRSALHGNQRGLLKAPRCVYRVSHHPHLARPLTEGCNDVSLTRGGNTVGRIPLHTQEVTAPVLNQKVERPNVQHSLYRSLASAQEALAKEFSTEARIVTVRDRMSVRSVSCRWSGGKLERRKWGLPTPMHNTHNVWACTCTPTHSFLSQLIYTLK